MGYILSYRVEVAIAGQPRASLAKSRTSFQSPTYIYMYM